MHSGGRCHRSAGSLAHSDWICAGESYFHFPCPSIWILLRSSSNSLCIYTSSTAQSGGGSFENRKPIGEVGCCESRMTGRSHWWTDKWLRSPLFLSLSFSFSDYLPTYLPTCLCIYLSICLSVCLSICKLENEAILRDILIFWSWPHQNHQKQSNSARLPHFSKLTTSQTNQFWETSSIFQLDNIKNKAILRDFLQKWKVECRANSLVPMRFATFPVHLSKVLRLLRESDARSYEALHLSRKINSANLKIWCSKMQPLSGKHHPGLLTAPMKMSLVLHLPRKMHLCRSSSNAPRLPSFLEMLQNPHVLLTFDKVHNPLRLPRGTRSERPKVVRTLCFCTFWLRNVLRATTACTFSTSQLPKVVRTWCVFNFFTYKCASHQNGVHFFDISTSKNGPNVRCF